MKCLLIRLYFMKYKYLTPLGTKKNVEHCFENRMFLLFSLKNNLYNIKKKLSRTGHFGSFESLTFHRYFTCICYMRLKIPWFSNNLYSDKFIWWFIGYGECFMYFDNEKSSAVHFFYQKIPPFRLKIWAFDKYNLQNWL